MMIHRMIQLYDPSVWFIELKDWASQIAADSSGLVALERRTSSILASISLLKGAHSTFQLQSISLSFVDFLFSLSLRVLHNHRLEDDLLRPLLIIIMTFNISSLKNYHRRFTWLVWFICSSVALTTRFLSLVDTMHSQITIFFLLANRLPRFAASRHLSVCSRSHRRSTFYVLKTISKKFQVIPASHRLLSGALSWHLCQQQID